MYFLFYLPSKRERTQQAALLAGIKKNDHVVTTSGIYGVVTDVSKDTNKVTLRIDESTGAKTPHGSDFGRQGAGRRTGRAMPRRNNFAGISFHAQLAYR